MTISWIIILYNTPQSEIDRLKQEISTINSAINLIFVDNSTNGKGYSEGVNEGIKKALQLKTELFIVSNPDISVVEITKQDILNLYQQFDVGGFALKQNSQIFYGGKLDTWRMSGGLIIQKPSVQYQPVDFISGSFMVISRKVIESIGLFDESYGMYYEDVDYCIRAKRAGFTIGINALTFYDHFETSDTNPQKKYFLAKNRLKILLQYGSWKQKMYELFRVPKTLYEYFC